MNNHVHPTFGRILRDHRDVVRTEAEAIADIVIAKPKTGSLAGDFDSPAERAADGHDAEVLDAMERLTKDYQGRMEKLHERLHRKDKHFTQTIHGYLHDMAADTYGSLRNAMDEREEDRRDR